MRITDTKVSQYFFGQKLLELVALVSVILFTLSPGAILAQPAQQALKAQPNGSSSASKTGILLLAHGGSRAWNAEVNKLAAQVNRTIPVEVAFGMATKRTMQEAIDKLVARGVSEIVAVPLFISSHSSVVTSTQYLLGQRADAPPDLKIFAKMDHTGDMGGDHSMMKMDSSFDPMTPVKSPVPIRMSGALDRHSLVADILLSRAQSISQEPAREVVVLVAHGPVPDDDNAKWLGDMSVLAERMRGTSKFNRIEYLTVRDDADEPLRAQAATELRKVVEQATAGGNKVLIVPLLLSYGGIEEGVKKRLDGLTYVMTNQGLLPDERLAQWVLLMAGSKSDARRSTEK